VCPTINAEVVIKAKACFIVVMLFAPALMTLGCSEPLTKREQGGLLGAGLGAGTGAIIGSTVGHAAGGALIGDQLMGQDRRQDEQQQAIDRNQEELARLRRENQRPREGSGDP